MLEFNEETHVYTWNGNPVPSVTQVIGEWRKFHMRGADYYISNFTGDVVSAEQFEAGGDFGTAIHQACAIIMSHGRDGLDWFGLSPDLVPPLYQFEKWLEDFSPTIISVEEPLYSKRFGFAGTADIFAEQEKHPTVVEIKTGAHAMAGPQTSGYERLKKEKHKIRSKVNRAALYLPKDGSAYTYKALKDPKDWNFFQSRLYQHEYLKG